jgi:putative ABC transport system ATP-binding protein
MKQAPYLSARGLTRRFREGERAREVLHGVDLDIAGGETVIVLGPSGSGKSTLLNLIAGIDLPDAGDITIGGKPLTTMTERQRTLLRRHEIGFIFQFFHLVPTLTVEENVRFPLELVGRRGRDARNTAIAMLDEVGLADRASTYPDVLSGGEQQRVAIARALVHSPRLILADEPTGNLDAENGQRIASLLGGLVRERGATMIVVTHAEMLLPLGDRVLTMRDGALA